MNEAYQVVSPDDTNGLPDSQVIAGLLAKDCQLILPLLDLVTANGSSRRSVRSMIWPT